MSRLLVLLLAVLTVATCAFAAPSAAVEPLDRPRSLNASACTTVRVGGDGFVLFRRGVECVWSKRWVRRLAASRGQNRPRGWTCSSGSKFRGGGYCERGSRHFGWHAGD